MDFYRGSLHFLGFQQLLPGTRLHCSSGFLLSLLDFWYPVFRSWWKLCPKKLWWLWSSKGSPQVKATHWKACRRCCYADLFWLRLFEGGESGHRRLCFAPAFWRWTDIGSLSSIFERMWLSLPFKQLAIHTWINTAKIHGDIFDFIQQGNKVMIIDHSLPKREDIHNFVFVSAVTVDVYILLALQGNSMSNLHDFSLPSQKCYFCLLSS